MLVQALKKVAYDPSRFVDVESLTEAVNIIVMPYGDGLSSQQRWSDEAPALMTLIERHIKPRSCVIDFGCGAGRMACPLVHKLDCNVFGIDISSNMRALADSLVNSPKFVAFHPDLFVDFRDRINLKFDAAISVWALQHVLDLEDSCRLLADAIERGGSLVLVNTTKRFIPVEGGGWADDGKDVDKVILASGFTAIERGLLDDKIAPGVVRQETFWAAYRKV